MELLDDQIKKHPSILQELNGTCRVCLTADGCISAEETAIELEFTLMPKPATPLPSMAQACASRQGHP